jgi:hypothetical protein
MTADVRPSGVLRFFAWLTAFNTWVLFEETIVDRYGLWQWMPYYRVARLCAWDIGAIVLLGVVVWRLFRRPPREQSAAALP